MDLDMIKRREIGSQGDGISQDTHAETNLDKAMQETTSVHHQTGQNFFDLIQDDTTVVPQMSKTAFDGLPKKLLVDTSKPSSAVPKSAI